MIVQCPDCKTRFQLDAARIPASTVRVRCSRCAYVFAMDGRQADMAAPAPSQAKAASARPTGFGEIDLDSGPRETPPPMDAARAKQAPAAKPTPPPAPGIPVAEPSVAHAGPASGSVPTMPEMDFEIERSSPPMRPGKPAPATMQSGSATAVEAPPTPQGFPEIDLDARAAAADAPAEAPADPKTKRELDKARRLARALVSDILVYNRESRDKALAQGNLVQALGPEIKKSWEVYKERVTPEVANSTNHFRDALNEILAEGQPIF